MTGPGTEMPTRYDATSVEPRWAETWIERGYFHASVPDDPSRAYCIVIPPPNVTGRLHVGHALGRTLEDVLIRRARMRGLEALWVPGMDHAGIATQVVVERELRKEGIERRDLGREAFIERVWAWKERYGGEIIGQLQRMGASLDWERERFTMDDGLVRAVRVAFVRWYEQGLIYRGERLVNWCPTDQTGLSDSEVEHEEVDGELLTFRYPLSDGTGHVEVATTRVETMLGDTGIAVHPDDARYRDLVGKTVRHPFDGRELPIVADGAVDPAFGTGAVKVTPAHDPTDFEIAQRTGLPLLNILDAEARINANAAEEFYGLGRYDARQAVREELEKLGLFVGVEHPYRHSVGHCYRCHSEIEPWMSGLQWFVAVDRLKGPATQAAARRADHVLPRALAEGVRELAGGPSRLEHLAAALVGSPDPRLVLPGRSRHGGARGPGRLRDVRRRGDRAGPGRAGHVVLLAALAVLDARLAGRHARARGLLSEHGARDGLRDPLSLGRADDHVGDVARRRHPVPRRRDPRAGARRARPQDVEVPRQRDRPRGDLRSPRGRRTAILAGAARDRGQQDIPLSMDAIEGGRATSRTRSGTPPGSCCRRSTAGSRSSRRTSG